MKMKLHIALLLLLLLLLLPLSLAGPSSCRCTCSKSVAGVETTCKAAADANPSIDYDFCVTSLNSQPNTNSADLQGLAAAATKLAIAHVESTESKIEDFIALALYPGAQRMYGQCLDAYEDASDRMKDALDSINDGLYARATMLLRAAPGAYKRCEEVVLGWQGLDPPVAEEDSVYERFAEMAIAIMATEE